jgi:hypothetical protein
MDVARAQQVPHKSKGLGLFFGRRSRVVMRDAGQRKSQPAFSRWTSTDALRAASCGFKAP